jgi:flagellar motor switch protein FliN/FliY
MQVTIELGKCRKTVKEILDFNSGTILVLEKLAGEPVEVVVNDKLIARGEVIQIDDNYGVRITEILNKGKPA